MKPLCNLRDIFRSIRDFEEKFHQMHNLGLNEAMMLCSLCSAGKLASTELAEVLGLTTSNTSKVIKSVEVKGFVERFLGEQDKRQMYFVLTDSGKKKLSEMKNAEAEILNLLNVIRQMTTAR